ncbi:bacteriohemerythrin [Magnetospirillum sp. SS-4]|uniref:bacteriohemerythrin n=1 Tax=Magnetospirillum sp. SS-4 TaxID=2681465 RepID=UPI00137EDF27|nr:bacteriohemerythrin [Magnetospirillum sp. SS-4]CAA7622981.1 Hemerythrin-like protein [Magnetospirillum sp. SS-4]
MAWVAWNESLAVGNALLDSDHRLLIDLLNQLHDAIDTGQSRDVIGNVVSVLAEYVEHHFQREEAIMADAGFPGMDAHLSQHRDLGGRVRRVRDRYLAGERGALAEDVVDLLKKWLTEHIQVSDNSYKPWVARASGDGMGPSAMARKGGNQS